MDPRTRLARFIRWCMRDVTFHKHYPSTVVRQDGMFVDVQPDDEAIRGPGLSRVPLRIGVPGMTCTLADRARVLLSFDNGNPDQPAAALFDPGSVREVVFDGGTQALARQGDLVAVGGALTIATFMTNPPPIPPTPAPMMTGTPYLISFSPVPPTAVYADPLYGSIMTGRLEFKA